MNMKRIGLWAVGIGVLISLGLFTVESGYADEKEQEHATTCTLATLKGRYLFVENGTFFPPAGGVTTESLFDVAGYRIFYGDGAGTQINRLSVNGVVRPADLHTDLSYTVNADCTGTLKELSVGDNSEIFIAPNGDAMTVINTNPGHVQAYSSWRVGPE